jgi:hypothetical protein
VLALADDIDLSEQSKDQHLSSLQSVEAVPSNLMVARPDAMASATRAGFLARNSTLPHRNSTLDPTVPSTRAIHNSYHCGRLLKAITPEIKEI